MDKRTWDIWQKGQSDPEYALLYQQMYALGINLKPLSPNCLIPFRM